MGERRNIPTTKALINEALRELNADQRKGVTLYGVKKFICEKYKITMTYRKTIIKKYMHELLESGQLQNVTGSGLNGHLRLVTGARVRRLIKRHTTRAVTPPARHIPSKKQSKAQMVSREKLLQAPKRKLFTSTALSQAIEAEDQGTPRSSLNKEEKRKRRGLRKERTPYSQIY